MACSCAKQTIIINKKYIDNVGLEPSYQKTNHFIFWGVGQKANTRAQKICKDLGEIVVKVEFVKTAPNVILSNLTLGIYNPRTVKVYCAKK